MRSLLLLIAATVFSATSTPAFAISIGFETTSGGLTPFVEGDSVGNELLASLGVSFVNAVIVTPTRNTAVFESESPAHSGLNVVIDAGGPISIVFANPVTTFSGYFTYFAPLTVQAYDTADNALATVNSSAAANYGSSGNLPNELLAVSFPGGISRVVLTADPSGGSFTLDDVSFTRGAVDIPEPATFSLVALGLCALGRRKRLGRAPDARHASAAEISDRRA